MFSFYQCQYDQSSQALQTGPLISKERINLCDVCFRVSVSPEVLGFLTAVGLFIILMTLLFWYLSNKLALENPGSLQCLDDFRKKSELQGRRPVKLHPTDHDHHQQQEQEQEQPAPLHGDRLPLVVAFSLPLWGMVSLEDGLLFGPQRHLKVGGSREPGLHSSSLSRCLLASLKECNRTNSWFLLLYLLLD